MNAEPHRLEAITAVTFDAAGTLLHPHPSVGAIYAEVARRHGATADATALEPAFRAALDAVSKDHTLENPEERERDFWCRLVQAAFAAAEVRPRDFAACFAELWETFAHATRWRVVPDADPTLRTLRSRGYQLAVLSNWDRRLHTVLAETGLRPRFDHVLISSEVGAEKPAPAIFRAAERAFAVPPAQCLHIGDSPRHDRAGARAAGWTGLLVDPDQGAPTDSVRCLAELLPLLPALATASATPGKP